MKISMQEPLKPFSHVPGTEWLLPGSFFSVKVFPGKIVVFNQQKSFPTCILEIYFDFQGPLNQFTVISDLDRGKITVSGKAKQGWMRYHLDGGSGIRCVFDRVPENMTFEINGVKQGVVKNQPIFFFGDANNFSVYQMPCLEKLFLGNHKAQDCELIRKRQDLTEIFPIVFRWGQLLPKQPDNSSPLLESKRRNEEEWKELFLGTLSYTFVPRFFDDDYQAIKSFKLRYESEDSPLKLLSEIVLTMREIFIQTDKNNLILLSQTLPLFHCGRIVNFSIAGLGTIHLEWTKNCIRRIEIYAEEDVEWTVKINSPIRTCRIRQRDLMMKHSGNSCKGNKGIVWNNHSLVCFRKGFSYFFDNFR